MKNFEIISVNYNTPDLINNLLNSIRLFYEMPIRIIDGSDKEEYQIEVLKVCSDYRNTICNQLGYNIHHGGGMDYAMRTTTHDWVLIIDSDSTIRQGLLEALVYDKPYCGFGMQVDKNGFNVDTKGLNKSGSILYLHPHFLLVNTNYYRNSPYKFIKHGAPAIQIMANIPDDHKNVLSENYQVYFNRGGRGTVSRFGYQL